MSAVQAMIGSGMSQAAALTASGAPEYKSRGKGKKSVVAKVRRFVGKHYPFSSAKQHAKHAERQYTAIVNGFPLMQTKPSWQRG